jgi:hypothetical protein
LRAGKRGEQPEVKKIANDPENGRQIAEDDRLLAQSLSS